MLGNPCLHKDQPIINAVRFLGQLLDYLHRNSINQRERYKIDILDLAMLSPRLSY